MELFIIKQKPKWNLERDTVAFTVLTIHSVEELTLISLVHV